MRLLYLQFVCAILLTSILGAATVIWTGPGIVNAPAGGNFNSAGNWAGDALPDFNASTEVQFGHGSYWAANDLGSIDVNRISFDGPSATFRDEIIVYSGEFVLRENEGKMPMITSSGLQVVKIETNLRLEADSTIIVNSKGGSDYFEIGYGASPESTGGNINLNEHTLTIIRNGPEFASATARIGNFRRVISGTGKIVVEDLVTGSTGTILFGGRNTYSGGTELRTGILTVLSSSILEDGVIQEGPLGTGPITIFGGTLRSSGDSVRTLHNDLIAAASFQLGQRFRQGIAIAGAIQLNESLTITVPQSISPGPVRVEGAVNELEPNTALTWDLQSTLVLSGVSTYTGPTLVRGGTLRLTSTGSIQSSHLTLTQGAVLQGDGTTASIDAENGTTISPGVSRGILHTRGVATLKEDARLSLELTNETLGTGYDSWDIEGTLSLNDSELQLILGFDPVDFVDVFWLIANDGDDPIRGIFEALNGVATDLNEGSRFFVGSQEFEISYTAERGVEFFGSGNDLAIRALPEPGTFVLLWLSWMGVLAKRRRSPER